MENMEGDYEHKLCKSIRNEEIKEEYDLVMNHLDGEYVFFFLCFASLAFHSCTFAVCCEL